MTIQVQVAKMVLRRWVVRSQHVTPPSRRPLPGPKSLQEFTSKEDHKTTNTWATWMNAPKTDSLSGVEDKQADKV